MPFDCQQAAESVSNGPWVHEGYMFMHTGGKSEQAVSNADMLMA